MGNLVRSRIITTKVFVVLVETSYFRYYIFSYWHRSFVKRNKKILHLLCIASPATNFRCQNNCDKWGYNWFGKTSSVQAGKWISKFLQKIWREERFTFVKQIFQDLVFERLYVLQRKGEWAKIYKAEFWDDETIHFKQLTSFSPLPKCYVSRGRRWR